MGLVLMLLGALLAVLTLELLVSCALNTGITSYSGLTLKVFGFRVAKACEAAMIIYCFGSCVGYLIIIGSCLDALLASSLSNLPAIFTKDFNLLLITTLVVLPLTCLKDLSKLRYASLVSVAAMLYLSTAVVVRAVVVGPDLFQPLASMDDVLYARFDGGFPKSACLVFFAYASHMNLLGVHAQVTNPSMRRMTKVTRRSVLLELILYCAFGGFGYLSFHDVTCGNVLQNYPKDDLLFVIARIAVVCSLSVVCPLIFSPAHADVDRLLFTNLPFSWPRHILVSFVLVAMALVLAIFIPEVSVVFGLLGATMSILFCFALPIMLFIYTSPIITRFNIYTLEALLVILTLVGIAGVVDIVYDLTQSTSHSMACS